MAAGRLVGVFGEFAVVDKEVSFGFDAAEDLADRVNGAASTACINWEATPTTTGVSASLGKV